MSFNIPDINPYINITLEDTIKLLLSSIALEEVSLSKLIDAETEKILYVINQCRHTCSSADNILEVNKSVDNTIKNIIKLQMLLQFKLENIKEIIPSTTTASTTFTSTTTTNTCTRTTTTKCKSSTTACNSSFSTTTTKCKCKINEGYVIPPYKFCK